MMQVIPVTAFKAHDGSIHESEAQALARNITLLPVQTPRGQSSPFTPAAAWAMIEHRSVLIDMLSKLILDEQAPASDINIVRSTK